MTIIKILLTILTLAIVMILAYFLQPLRWEKEDSRPSIIGFAFMIWVLLMDAVLIWV